MKRIIIVAALVTLAACQQQKAAPASEATEKATEATATGEPLAADGKPTVGKFEVTDADGGKVRVETKADGTFSVADAAGKAIDSGKWEQKSPTQYCETSDKPGSQQVCYDEKVENGVYTSYNPVTKKTSTVVRIEG